MLSFWCVQWGKVIGGSVKNLQCYSFGVRFNWCKMIEDPDMQLSRTDQTQPTMANLGPVLRKLSWPRATSRLSSPLLGVLNIPACNIPFTTHQSNQSNHNPFSAQCQQKAFYFRRKWGQIIIIKRALYTILITRTSSSAI